MAYQIDSHYCVGCQACYRACPFGAVVLVDPHYAEQEGNPIDFSSFCNGSPLTHTHGCYIDPAKCKECGFCAKECPVDVITLVDENGAPKERPHYTRIFIEESECIGCSKCKRNCPMDAIDGVVKKPFHIDESKCVLCGVCLHNCPKDAIHGE